MRFETALLTPKLRKLCGTQEWCAELGHIPYNESCSGNPYTGGSGYAYKALAELPQDYLPIAYQFERMRSAGIVPVKGAGHEGWKGALPYPDCSPALLSVGVVFAGTQPQQKKESLVEGGWTAQGWRWHPSAFCEEKTIAAGQVTCITNNAEKIGFGLSDGTVVSPLMSAHPFETQWQGLGNAWVTPYVVAAVAVLKSSNLAPDLSAADVMDVLYHSGDIVWDRRKCDQDPATDEPDGWLRVDFAFHDMVLQPLATATGDELSRREEQLLKYPWAYVCTDPLSTDTAPFHSDNVSDFSNHTLNIGAAVETLLKQSAD